MNSMWSFSRQRSTRDAQGPTRNIRLLGLAALLVLAATLIGLENYRSTQLQIRRTAEQTQLLADMETLQNPAVSQLVADWRLNYPDPSEERLAELRDLAQQVRNDPAALDAPRLR
jgi:hypothetical protein